MMESVGLNTEALSAEMEYRRNNHGRSFSRRPLPRNRWWRRNAESGR